MERSIDREKVIENLKKEPIQPVWKVEYMNTKVDMVEVVRCKYCINRGKAEKCILAAIAEEKGWPVFFLDNHGEWYCADGKRQSGGEAG